MSTYEISVLMPFVWPAIAAALVLLFGRDGRRALDPAVFGIASAGLGLGFVQLAHCWQSAPVHALFSEALRVDRFSVMTIALVYGASFLTLLIGAESIRGRDRGRREFAVGVLLAALGLGVMIASRNLVLTLVGGELAGLGTVALLRARGGREQGVAGHLRGQGLAFGLGAFGAALVLRAVGSADFVDIAARAAGSEPSYTLVLGLGTFAVSLALRTGLAPFHFGRQDVVAEGSAAAATFLTTAWPLAGLAALARLALSVEGDAGAGLRDALWWIALLAMSLGNLAALGHGSVRRILAGAATARIGWMTLALAAGLEATDAGRSLASAGFVAMTVSGVALLIGQGGAFALVGRLEAPGQRLRLDDLRGLGARDPAGATALAVFVGVLAGVPGTIGFLGRFAVLTAALDAATRTGDEAFTVLAILGIVNGLIGLAAYLRIPLRVFLDRAPEEQVRGPLRSPSTAWSVTVSVLVVSALWLGFGPELAGFGADTVLGLARRAAFWMH